MKCARPQRQELINGKLLTKNQSKKFFLMRKPSEVLVKKNMKKNCHPFFFNTIQPTHAKKKNNTILCLFSIILEPSEALHAHCSYCKHHKTLSDYLSNYQVLFKFDIGNVICDDPTASIPHSGLLSCCYGSLTPN